MSTAPSSSGRRGGWRTLTGATRRRFFAPDFAAGPAPTLSETWAHGAGTYVFLPVPAPDGFAAALAPFIQGLVGAKPRFLWIANPAAPAAGWTATGIATAERNGSWVVAQKAGFDLSGYRVTIRDGGTVGVANNGSAGWGFAFADTVFTAAAFVTPGGDMLHSGARSTSLSMQDRAAGCWRFSLLVPGATDGFALLDCGLRYFTGGVGGQPFVPLPLRALRQRATTPLTL